MICSNCDLKSICKVFEMANNMSPSMNIVVNDCRMRPNGESMTIAQQVSAEVPLVHPHEVPLIHTQESLISRSEKIRQAIKKTKVVEVVEPTKKTERIKKVAENIRFKCKKCGSDLPKSLTVKCEHCGGIFCNGCVTIDLGTNKQYCEDCWDKVAPAATL